MAKIFISYKRADKGKVFSILDEIKKNTRVDYWVDLEGIETGDQFQNVIIDAIDKAEIVIVMLSKNFIAPYKDETGEVNLKKQTFPQKEVMYALNHDKRLVPLSIDGTTVKDCKWLEFNCAGIDCVEWENKDQKNKLFKNLRQWCDVTETLGEGSKETKTETAKDEDSDASSSWISKHKKSSIFALFAVLLICALCCWLWPNTPSAQMSYCEVDLGLPSGTLWADRNIGASSEKDLGELFSWGETKPKKRYAQQDHQDICVDAIMNTANDVATVRMGKEWHMPSIAQINELCEDCTWEWLEDESGFQGYKVTGPNGNFILLPAAGWVDGKSHDNKFDWGYYWSGEKGSSKPENAYCLQFNKKSRKHLGGLQYYGRSVRAVKDK